MQGADGWWMSFLILISDQHLHPIIGIYESASKKERITVHALNSAISKIQKLHDGTTYNGDPELSEVAQTYLLELHSILESVGTKGLKTPAKPTHMHLLPHFF
jgi:hypothetical protein